MTIENISIRALINKKGTFPLRMCLFVHFACSGFWPGMSIDTEEVTDPSVSIFWINNLFKNVVFLFKFKITLEGAVGLEPTTDRL